MAKGKYKKWLEPDNLTKLEGWARDGLKDTQIADNMGINVSTLYTWKNRYSEINETLKKGKEVVDYEIENSLISTMKKHTLTTTQYKMVKKDEFKLKAEREEFMNIYKFDHPEASKNEILIATAKGVEVYEKIPIIRTVTEVDPNISAMIFWLKARRPDVFRDQTFKKLNEAQARKAIAEANISEAQLKSLKEEDDPDNRTVIVDDISKLKELRDHEDSTDKQGD
ncbi:helix-turn-helix domain-containing protein [Lactobacillus helveticus]|uniref:Terminase n=1 Tax=Lactobacillus helveticus TaxID=1587 RepID=A0AAU8XV03_LACHE|nr:helix-turn-helix domain-containing protein [Lactobacillus helveticus]AUI74632.1 terminase [Lactobacillus helveticus]PXZ14770.1 helix-turn-helix domain-containing protein [Lactobacillus helveticus]PXZ16752.1 helix-turn-helix domain-containing protein [Lactobacillus helveticus]PXZ23464.1 helix-turn-helix domain-containing protein [Lactobacillus helveticus]PXZ26876.1 helix-turn-helix domain-containing protein [Lactobacillus helveticus]